MSWPCATSSTVPCCSSLADHLGPHLLAPAGPATSGSLRPRSFRAVHRRIGHRVAGDPPELGQLATSSCSCARPARRPGSATSGCCSTSRSISPRVSGAGRPRRRPRRAAPCLELGLHLPLLRLDAQQLLLRGNAGAPSRTAVAAPGSARSSDPTVSASFLMWSRFFLSRSAYVSLILLSCSCRSARRLERRR